jgi:hypothetical protein
VNPIDSFSNDDHDVFMVQRASVPPSRISTGPPR